MKKGKNESPIKHGNARLSQELLRIDRKAQQAYEGALRVIEDDENPDRFPEAAHSLREVTRIITPTVSVPQEIAEEKDTLKRKIERQFVEKLQLLPIPAGENAELLIRKWDHLNRFFVAVSHHGKDIDGGEFTVRLSDFEAILLEFLKPLPETLEDLDSLLEVQTPDTQHTKKLSESLKHPSHVSYFFSKLESPDWLEPLKKAGYFSNPPEGITAGTHIMFPSWPLSRYLVKIAAQKPKEVMEIIRGIDRTENFRIHFDFIECALRLPSSTAKEIIASARKWISNPYPNLTPTKLGDLCIKLHEENEPEAAANLLEILLDVKGPDEKEAVAFREAQPFYDLWEYQRILDNICMRVFQRMPVKIIQVLCNTLLKSITIAQQDTSPPRDDLSHLWRPAIEDSPQNREGRDVTDLLVSAIRNCFEKLRPVNEKEFLSCYNSLQRFDCPIFRRIEIHLMRKFPELLATQIKSVVSRKETFDEISLWHEYYHLLQEQYPNFPQELKDKILEWIDEGPDLKRYETWFKEKRKTKPAQTELDTYKADWQIRYLSPIRDAIPQLWRDRWRELVDRHGEPDHPDFHAYVGPVVVGSRPPLSEDEIEKYTPSEVLNLLKTWKPPKDPFGPSREGLALAFSNVVSSKPSDYTSICQDFAALHPVYVYHLLNGFRRAAEKGISFDWKPVVEFCGSIMTASEKEVPTDDSLYSWIAVSREIADLLEEGLKSKTVGLPLGLRERTWDIVGKLLQNREPDLAFEEKYGENLDPVSLSLNTVRGKAMHSAIEYALWCARQLKLASKNDKMVPEAKELFEMMLNPKSEPTKTIRAVYGTHLPWLLYLNKEWVERHVADIFPEDNENRPLWRAAWEAYITYCHLYNDLYRSIRSQYKIAIDKLASPKISKTAKDHLAHHILMAYLRELEHLQGDDSLVNLFFEKADSSTKGQAIWFIGRVVMDIEMDKIKGNEKDRIIGLIKNLWEWRIREAKEAGTREAERFVQELKMFGMWFVHSVFDKDWSITQLYTTLDLTGGNLEFANQVIEKLDLYVEEHYLMVLASLTMLAKQESQNWILVVSIEKIRELVAKVVKEKPHQEIKLLVNDLVEVLAKKGYHEFAGLFIR